MTKISTTRVAVVTLLIAGMATFLVGCGSSSPLPGLGSGAGSISVKLVDGPLADYKEINVHILKVEIAQRDRDNSSWITLGTPDVTVNLLSLTGGVSTTLVPGASLSAGHYGQMRLILGDNNTVKLADDSVHNLTIPSGQQTGIKLIVDLDVATGTTHDVFIDFDAARSIRLHSAGQSGKYLLRPVVRAYDKVLTGSIGGTLTTTDNSTALPGAIVTAQKLDETGHPTIVRTTTADDNGTYLLDLLPVGSTYYVVSQPVVAPNAYEAKVSDAIALTEQAPTATANLDFALAASTGQMSGSVSPAAGDNDSDTINVIQSLTIGGNGQTFIVRTAIPTVTDPNETYSADLLPVGDYTVGVSRVTTSDNGTAYQSASSGTVTVTSGTTATADLHF